MFELLPFERGERSLYDYFSDMEKNMRKGMSVSSFRTDIEDAGDHYELKAELPGFQKEDINVEVEDGYLTISASHNEEKKSEDENHFVRRERHYGAFRRSFDVEGINKESITAAYENGILKLNLPKAAEAKPTKQQITVA